MKSLSQQTLFIPDVIKIQFIDEKDSPALVSNVVIAIKTSANYKNDITISPFASDENGIITIVKKEIKSKVDDFISFSIMDYVNVTFSRPTVSIIFLGTTSINRQLGIEIDPLLLSKLNQFIPDFNESSYKLEQAAKAKQNKYYSLFISCYNSITEIKDDLILIEDNWGKPCRKHSYRLKLPF